MALSLKIMSNVKFIFQQKNNGYNGKKKCDRILVCLAVSHSSSKARYSKIHQNYTFT